MIDFFIFRQQTKDKDSPAMIWTVILSLIPSVGPQVYLQNICNEHILLNLYKSITHTPSPQKHIAKINNTCPHAPSEHVLQTNLTPAPETRRCRWGN